MIRKRRIPVTTTGAAGSAAGSALLSLGRPGFVRAIKVDYHASAPVTTDVVLKADSSTGATLFTKSDNATDIAATPVGMPGIDETGAAIAATDASSGGFPFSSGIYVSVAQADALTNAVVVDVWVEV